ncbi:MAG: DUF86 domain-containing protein [Bacteroidota bacterium]
MPPSPEKDVVFAKIGIIKRCLQRIHEATADDPDSLKVIDKQDVFVLNLQRAIQGAIDLAAHIVSSEGLGVPQDLKDNFDLLREKRIIPYDLVEKMKKMVGFRNIAVHEYQELKLEVLQSILSNNIKELEEFYTAIVKHYRLGKE